MSRGPESPSESWAEWRFVLYVVLGVLLVTTLPYVYAYATAPSDKEFMGIMLDVPDHAQYFSWMRELSQAPLAANKMTPEPNEPVFFNLLWWGLGRLGRLLGLGYSAVFQLLRIGSASSFLLLAYHVCARFLARPLERRTAFLLLTLGSGLGWALIAGKYTLARGSMFFPSDVYTAEGNTFLGILGYPHFIAAALYIGVFELLLYGQTRGQLRYAVAGGAVALFLGWQHAYDLITIYGVIAAYIVASLLRDRRLPAHLIKSGFIIGFISWWPALYSVLLTSTNPTWKEVLAQFPNAGVYTPGILHLPVLLGIAFVLAVFTVLREAPRGLRGLTDRDLFCRSWFLVTFLLVYLPVDYQIHLLNGWQVPIAILATQGMSCYVAPFIGRLADRWRWLWSPEGVRRGLAIGLVLCVLPTNLYLWAWRFVDLGRHDYPYYLHKSELAAMAWLQANAQPADVVLSSETIGQYVPAYTGTHAFLAHWAQTLDYHGKSALVKEFYAQCSSEPRRQQVLEEYGVDYVFWGPAERALGSFDPDKSGLLRLVFSVAQAQVYAVQ